MPNPPQHRSRSAAARSSALALPLILGTAACATPPTIPAALAAPFVLSAGGDPVRADSPPGVEVTLGGKRVLPAEDPSQLD
jgi:hypothetical protein